MKAESERLPVAREWVLALARSFRVLPMVERYYARRRVEAAAQANEAYRNRQPDITFPPADLIQRTYGDPLLQSYYSWGTQNAAEVEAAIERHKPHSAPKVAEWGSGLGRISMHLEGKYDLTGFDIDPSSVGWCQKNLEGTYHLNEPSPPLPADEGSFDVVYAVSIFTHLSERAHLAWRDEIFRVLKPGGVFLFTVHGEAQSENLLPPERRSFEKGEIVVRGGVEEGSRIYLAYHPPRFVEEVLLAPFEKLEGPVPACGQTLYAGRKPA